MTKFIKNVSGYSERDREINGKDSLFSTTPGGHDVKSKMTISPPTQHLNILFSMYFTKLKKHVRRRLLGGQLVILKI